MTDDLAGCCWCSCDKATGTRWPGAPLVLTYMDTQYGTRVTICCQGSAGTKARVRLVAREHDPFQPANQFLNGTAQHPLHQTGTTTEVEHREQNHLQRNPLTLLGPTNTVPLLLETLYHAVHTSKPRPSFNPYTANPAAPRIRIHMLRIQLPFRLPSAGSHTLSAANSVVTSWAALVWLTRFDTPTPADLLLTPFNSHRRSAHRWHRSSYGTAQHGKSQLQPRARLQHQQPRYNMHQSPCL